MTAAEFRRIALSLPETEEGAHMGHADFRVGGKVFATLGYPKTGFGMVRLSAGEQEFFVGSHARVLRPANGAWGKAGATIVALRPASKAAVRAALVSAWRSGAPKRPARLLA